MASKKSISASEDQAFRMMFESHTAIMLLIAPETGLILEANSAAESFYGYPKSILCGMTISDMNTLAPEPVALQRQKALEDGQNSFIIPQRLTSGEERLVEIHSAPINFKQRQVLFSIVIDITGRNPLQESAPTSQLDRATELVIANKEISFQNEEKANRAAELVIANKELVFQNKEKASRAAELVIIKENALHSKETARQTEDELRNANVDLGNTVYQRDLSLKDLSSHQIELKMQNDELRLSQEQLEITRARYFELYDLAPVGYCTISEKGLILEANLTAASLLGVPKTALIKKPFSQFITWENGEIYYLHRKKLIETGLPQAFELQMRKKDGTSFWAHLETSAALDTNGTHMTKVTISDITEQKRAEAQIKKQLKELSCLNAVSRLALDPALTKADLCQQVAELLVASMGFPELAAARIELDGQYYQTTKYTDSSSLTAPILYNAKKYGQITVCYSEDQPFLLPDGQNLLDNVANVLGLWHEKKISDRDVRKLSQAVEQSPVSILITDPNGTIEYANPHFCALTGYSLDEIVGENPRILQTGYTSQTEYQQLWETILSGKVWVDKLLNRKKNGGIYWEKASIAPIFDETGKITHFMAIKEDITAQKTMEGNLRQSESHNRALLSANPDRIFRLSRDGVILDYKSNSNELLFGHPDTLIGKSIFELLNDTTALKVKNYIDQTLQSMEIDIKIKDTIYVFEVRFTNLGDHEVVAIVRDISEQSRLEKMKSDFINRASHELRTPITTMLLMINLLDKTINKDGTNEYWDVLKSEINHERLLVEHLLNAGRLESGQEQMSFHPIEIDELIQQVVHDLDPAAREKNITLSLETITSDDRSPRQVQADQNALTQVFVNLVGNAIKFTPPGGEVCIRMQSDALGTQISIIDTGLGIPSKDLPLLFNRFFRGSNAIDEEIQGTGLGLFIVRSILEKHDGKIQVTSELGKGSQFNVWLPES